MKKSYIVDSTCNDMRIDRWIRNSVGKIPQGLIEKNLRAGKIKLNKKKIKSSYKIKTGDKIDLFNINFKENIIPELIQGLNILVAAHGNSLRALVMELEEISSEEIVELEISTGVPLIYKYEENKIKRLG